MPERKNQHYVPKHVLKGWTSDDSIDIIHLESSRVFSQDLTEVCSRNYFYGNPSVEEKISHLEGLHAQSINRFRDGDSLVDLSNDELKILLSFVTTQRLRTKSIKSDIETGKDILRESAQNRLQSEKFQEVINWKSELSDEEKEKILVEASILGSHHRLLVNGILGYIQIRDLEGVMLRNLTNREFVISDAPIVHDNPRYKHSNDLVVGGLASRGLQIYVPIDSDRVLLLYDPEIYKFDHNSKKQILIKSTEVINHVNLLQFHNANSIVMYDSCDEKYIKDMAVKADESRQRKEIMMSLEPETGETINHVYVPQNQLPQNSPDIPYQNINTHWEYTERRTHIQVHKQKQLVNLIFEKTFEASDMAVIYAIELFKQTVEN